MPHQMRSPVFRLIGAERSYFTAKVRPALRAKRVTFEEIPATPGAYREILRRTGLAFIPVVVTPEDATWQDTSEILDALEARFPDPALYPTTPVQRLAASLLELYADEFMILPAMHFRWSTPEGEREARGAFAALSGDPETANRFADRIRASLPPLGVNKDTIPPIEAHLDELLGLLEELFAEQPFLLGRRPSLADCSLMGPLYAHLYLDVVPGPWLRARAPRTGHWIERMNHPDPGAFGDFLPGDALHPALGRILGLVGRDALPVVLDTVRAVEAWADARPEGSDEPPRAVGMHATRLRGVAMQRYTSPYTLWMVQRPLDAYRALPAPERAAVDRALAGSACEALLAYAPRHRLGKRRFRLAFEAGTPR
jgi:glutathione S-transferase